MRAVILFLFITLFTNLFAQPDSNDGLKKKVAQYESGNLQEKLFVHTDKSFYVAGEIVWFKVYDMDAATHELLDVSKVSYVEITSRDNKPLLQAKVKLQNGTGKGSFLLPFSVNSDNYVLKAYTSWMKNFSADYYFEKPLTIVNTLKKNDAKNLADTAYDIQFFPEGGNLVNGLESVIGFKGTDEYGKSIQFSGFLLNDKNDTLTRFQPYKSGMGKFLFTPSANTTYKAVIKVNSRVFTKPFPQVYEQGYVMKAISINNNQLVISVASTTSSSLVYVWVHSPGAASLVQRLLLNNGKAEWVIDKNNLAEGISQLTLFSEAQQPLSERLFYKQPKQKFSIDSKTDQSLYNIRKQVQLQISTTDSLQPTPANLSLSVFRLDSLQTIDSANIFTYAWLCSEIKGNIESPGYYLSDSSSEAAEALDNLLLTQGWRRFQWKDVLQQSAPRYAFLPEYEGQTITATIRSRETNLPAANVRAYLSVPGDKFQFSNGVSNDSGKVTFVLSRFYGAGEMVIQTEDTTNHKYNITFANPFSQTSLSSLLPPLILPETVKNQLLENSINIQVQNAYLPDERQHFLMSNEEDTTVFYGRPDKRYLLDDYTRFPTMEEVMREYVTEVRLSKEKERYRYMVANLPYADFFRDAPLVLLDGIPVQNTNQVVAYNPLLVRQLDVVTHKYYLGDQIYNGIVSYHTYNGDAAGLELNTNAIQASLDGLQFEREFYAPQYQAQPQAESRLPDFRNVLQWSPDIITDKNGKQTLSFYTSDLTGNFAVSVQGITSKGLVGSKVIFFRVVK